ncbi:hypothetical protein Ancab_008085, partial [Ancistrocladus abbreviatus]
RRRGWVLGDLGNALFQRLVAFVGPNSWLRLKSEFSRRMPAWWRSRQQMVIYRGQTNHWEEQRRRRRKMAEDQRR